MRSVLIDFSFEIQTHMRFEFFRITSLGAAEVCGVCDTCVCEC